MQRELAATLSDTWELVVSCPEVWLGDAVRLDMHGAYVVDGCLDSGHADGSILEVVLLERAGLTWRPAGREEPAVVEVALSESGPEHTLVTVYVEAVAEDADRAQVAAHWALALDRLVVAAAATPVATATPASSRAA